MFKSIKRAVEDSIIPMVMRNLIESYIRAKPETMPAWAERLNVVNMCLMEEAGQVNPKLRANYSHIVSRVAQKVIRYMQKEKFKSTKGFMVMIIICEDRVAHKALHDMCDEIKEDLVTLMNKDNGILTVLESAQKQVPKVLQVIKKEGYF